ncbi:MULTISPECIES: response regulator transcription factor [Agrobacterium]|jgi:two-component system response regulator AdeR|uniref:response regulator transcription factor n=1 Tax=Agrobacterium TaxID=357 RepID=UPI00039B26C4|nr:MULTISPECIES: response regulator [unclassified Agrobacterium]MDP9759708.1 hypothetical protein [Agrobacterium tumefaciens]MDQ1223515.1 hypothetical protein [Agrobacterium sp. SORGH_AS_0745]
MGGWEVLAEIQRRGYTPVIMVTALDEDVDRRQGLRIGADDHIVKPFHPIEVVTRAKAVLRSAGLAQAGAVVRVGNPTIDLDGYQAKIDNDGETIRLSLTLTKFRLLTHLARAPPRRQDAICAIRQRRRDVRDIARSAGLLTILTPRDRRTSSPRFLHNASMKRQGAPNTVQDAEVAAGPARCQPCAIKYSDGENNDGVCRPE